MFEIELLNHYLRLNKNLRCLIDLLLIHGNSWYHLTLLTYVDLTVVGLTVMLTYVDLIVVNLTVMLTYVDLTVVGLTIMLTYVDLNMTLWY